MPYSYEHDTKEHTTFWQGLLDFFRDLFGSQSPGSLGHEHWTYKHILEADRKKAIRIIEQIKNMPEKNRSHIKQLEGMLSPEELPWLKDTVQAYEDLVAERGSTFTLDSQDTYAQKQANRQQDIQDNIADEQKIRYKLDMQSSLRQRYTGWLKKSLQQHRLTTDRFPLERWNTNQNAPVRDGSKRTGADTDSQSAGSSHAKGDSSGGRQGLLWPGHEYLGPGNADLTRTPVDEGDKLAREHDIGYEKLITEGHNPYIEWNEYDEKFIQGLQELDLEQMDNGENVARILFGLKKKFHIAFQSEEEPAAKRQKTDDPAEKVTEPEETPDSTTTPETGVTEHGEEMGDTHAEGGSGGVSGSTWEAGATFSDNNITTTFSRICQIPDTTQWGYKLISSNKTGTSGPSDMPYLGITTPWGYIDINKTDLYFSPCEFQTLTERYETIRPKKLHVKIEHIIIKDVNKTATDTTVTDSATGGICLYEDKNYLLPYVIGNSQKSTPLDDPGKIYELPQYAYCTLGKLQGNATENKPNMNTTPESALYIIEHTSYPILTTGSEWSTTYTFPEITAKRLTAHNQNYFQTDNPLLDCRLWVLTRPKTAGQRYQTYEPIKANMYGHKPLNWMPGPSMAASDACEFVFHDTNQTAIRLIPGIPTNSHHEEYTNHDGTKTQVNMSLSWRDPGGDNTHAVQPREKHLQRTFGNSNAGIECHSKNTSKTVIQGHQEAGMNYTQLIPPLPGSNWDYIGFHYESQIWCKLPDTDINFIPHPAMGGWGLKSPPPQILMKMYPQPGPPTGSITTDANNLMQYSTFLLKATIEWEVTPIKTRLRWNPQPAVIPPSAGTEIPYMLNFTNSGTSAYTKPGGIWTTKTRVKNLC
nr:VP1 [Bat parvovirus]